MTFELDDDDMKAIWPHWPHSQPPINMEVVVIVHAMQTTTS